MNVGERIRKRRHELKITQQELARAIGVTPQHVSAIEDNKRDPSMSSLARLAQELGVTADYLITGKEGGIAEPIPAIKADKRLNLKAKKALIALIEQLYHTGAEENT